MYMLLSPVLFTACDKEDDVLPSTVRLSLALPETDFPAYTPTRTAGSDSATHELRLVIEVFPQGENTPLYDENAPLYNDTQFCTLQADGTVHLEEVKKALRKDTILVSIMCVNNETGCINDIRTIANYVHAHSRAMVHSDLVQALGKMELDLSFLDMATFSAHKIFGLKGSGLLYHRANVELLPLISAGQQEDGLRGGTSNAPTEIVFAKTLRLALEEQAAHIVHVRKINDYARSQLAQIPEIDINSPQEALPFILNFSCLCIGSEIMLNALDAKGFCVSAQSTCNSKGKAISHVLLAMGKDELHATHAVRLSFSHLTTMAQIDAFIQSLKEIIKDYATR